MKKLTTIATIIMGLFLFSGAAMAADAETLQPASDVIYDDNLIVNGYGDFNSIRIGEEGVGGVTYFNGTIINIGATVPVTFGDDVRIDGQIWGGPYKSNANDQALKIADVLFPVENSSYDIGTSSNRWRDLYLGRTLITKNIKLSGVIELNQPRTEYLSIAGPTCTKGDAISGSGWCENKEFTMTWPVNLPDGVRVKKFSGNLYNNNPLDMGCILKRADKSNPPALTHMGNIVLSSNGTDWSWKSDSSINNNLINNKSYSYYIGCSGMANDNVRVSNLLIEYQKSYID